MLFNNLSTERKSSLLVKNSEFYIEIAKFVQAYVTIVKNPNEFLSEIGETSIDAKKQHLKWEQLVKIMQTCDLGFSHVPTRMDLVVYYNYALEMGSVTALEKRIASVEEVAEAQKHYYNFIDEEKTNVEEEYLRQKKLYNARQREMDYVDGKIGLSRTKNVLAAIGMFLSIVIGMIGIVSFFVDNIFVSSIGNFLPFWKPQYVGGIIYIILMIVLFAIFNNWFVKTKYEFVKLKQASATIFARGDEMYIKQQLLKKKLDEVCRDYNIVQKEIHDKTKKYDVKHNIDILKTTNKFYQKLCESEELSDIAEKTFSEAVVATDDDFAPIKLSKEQEENMHAVKKEVIGLSGQIDMEAYNEKFEKSGKKKADKKLDEQEKETEQKTEEENKQKENEQQEKMKEQLKEQERAQNKEAFQDSVDYVKDLLGMNNDK